MCKFLFYNSFYSSIPWRRLLRQELCRSDRLLPVVLLRYVWDLVLGDNLLLRRGSDLRWRFRLVQVLLWYLPLGSPSSPTK